jgi:hypothetical protein
MESTRGVSDTWWGRRCCGSGFESRRRLCDVRKRAWARCDLGLWSLRSPGFRVTNGVTARKIEPWDLSVVTFTWTETADAKISAPKT